MYVDRVPDFNLSTANPHRRPTIQPRLIGDRRTSEGRRILAYPRHDPVRHRWQALCATLAAPSLTASEGKAAA